MMWGLFDLPAPLLQWVDERIATVAPAAISISFWAVVGGVLSLELYRLVSPQPRIRRIKAQVADVQQQLVSYDGEFEGSWPMLKRLLGLSLLRVGIIIPATLLAAYPVIALYVWLSSAYPDQYLNFGPRWMRGWEAIFLPVLFLAALAYKSARRID